MPPSFFIISLGNKSAENIEPTINNREYSVCVFVKINCKICTEVKKVK
jgi:hypothetical protein